MTSPKISIVTISYNSEKTIEDTILSVISQDYPNKEYIIIDGSSTDNTLNIIAKYKANISKVISEKDKGISDAFNKGISNSTGDIICLINSDDRLLPGSLSKVAQEFDGKADIYCGNVLLWNTDDNTRLREVPSTDFPLMPFFRHVAHQGMFATPDCYKTFGMYDTNIRFPMDLDFLVRVSQGNGVFHYMDINVAEFRIGGNTDSHSIFEKKNDYLYMVRKNGGNVLQAYIFYYFLVLTQVIKAVLSIFGMSRIRKLRYKKV